ncbi:hypothetical protein NUU61_007782 [Penicillium alfredii]|uniref:Uncharacterized protein n=1 Tax=Penicillium alfredii TaxID=1506179 RepID=A0A9W9JYS4_9EURO|nr:uncharacterized protein NUU61_007782 [Penicillium alfredii]KAJ5086475.1 hypothetical protein NUU61_007782 [Penicillium alfredii]
MAADMGSTCTEILQRGHFDWAEDVEDELESMTLCHSAGLGSFEASLLSHHLEDHDVYESMLSLSDTAAPQSSISSDEAACIAPEEESASSAHLEHREQPAVDYLTAADVENEFAYRNVLVDCEDEASPIHHFNWMGTPVYEHSATPPEESLAVILAGPKVPRLGDQYRIASILQRASRLIDPVLTTLDGTRENLLKLCGTKLVRACAGNVFKFYTPHGVWIADSKEMSGDTVPDNGSLDTYQASNLAIGNGFVQSSRIPSRSQWELARNEKLATSNKPSSPPRRLTWKPQPSPLLQSMVAEPDEVEVNDGEVKEVAVDSPVKDNKTVHLVKKKIWRRLACPSLTDSKAEYFSFPPPVLERSSKKKFSVRRLAKKLSRSILEVFGSVRPATFMSEPCR